MREKIILGLSGGVDSAVAAALLLREYDVIGVYLDIGLGGSGADDARAVADALGIPFAVRSIRAALEREVCAPFAEDYLAGRTPLPCARCNPLVKFPALLAAAGEYGASLIATGHYARTVRGENGRALLLRGQSANDQSFLLARLPQELLGRTRFPLGDYDKAAVRALAAELSLPVASKPDSMEICFVPDNDYAAWLDRRGATPPPGDFIDAQGNVMGRHKGIHHYTLGQRRGLGVSGPHRYFVSAIDPERNTVTLSDGGDLFTERVSCTDLNWISIPAPDVPLPCTVRLRHSRVEQGAVLTLTGSGALLTMETPARAPTAGQLAVFYDGDTVLGSGWIV